VDVGVGGSSARIGQLLERGPVEAMTDRLVTWDDFVDNFGAEMRIAEDVYQGMLQSGLKDWDTVSMDFDFVSEQRERLDQLRAFLDMSYQ